MLFSDRSPARAVKTDRQSNFSTGGGEDEALGCSGDIAAAGVDVERYEIQIQIHWN